MSSISRTITLKSKLLCETRRFVAVLTIASLAGTAFTLPAHADLPPAAAPKKAQDPQVAKFAAAAAQALKENNLSLATIQLKNALRLDPNNGALRFQLGTILMRQGDQPSAEREFRQARLYGVRDQDVVPFILQIMLAAKRTKDLLSEFPAPAATDKTPLAATIYRARALAYQGSGDAANAVASIDRSLSIQRDLDGVLTRAQIAILQSQPAEAMKYADQALALSPTNQTALMMKATILRFTDKPAALALMDTVIKANPNALTVISEKIELLVELQRNDEAQKNVDLLLAKAPNAPIALFYKGLLMGTRNQAKEGWRIVQSLPTEFIQSEARLAVGAAQLASAAGNVESAHAVMSAFVTRNPNQPEPRLRLGALRLRMNNAKGALEALNPLANSADPRALELLAAAYQGLNQQDNAMLYLRKAEAAGSSNSGIKYQIALDDLRKGNTARGVQAVMDGIAKQPNNLTGVGQTIELLNSQKKFAEAMSIANHADRLNSKSPIPPYLKAQILYSQGKRAESIAATEQALQRDPKYVLAYFGRAQVHIDEKRYAEASVDLKKAEAIEPNNPLASVKLAEIAAITKQTAQAVELIKKAIVKAPRHIPTRILLARYQLELNRNADAEKTLKDALVVAPNDPQALAMLSSVQQRMGQKTAALNTNKILVEKYQQSGAAQFLLANSLAATGDKKGALAATRRATELSPDVLQYRNALINLQIEAGDAAGAIDSARRWESQHKGIDSVVLVAQTYARVKRYAEAADVLAKNRSIAGRDSRLVLLESQIAMERGNSAQALTTLKDWLASHSTDVDIRKTYASILMQVGNNKEALVQYESILKTHNDIPDVLNNVAWMLRDTDINRATALASRAWELAQNSPDIADTYGYLLLKKGDAKGALPVLQRAHAIGPDKGEISYHLAMALNALGRKAEAKSTLQAALAKGSNFEGAADAKKLLQQL